jgi:hypothetical protein
MIPPPNPNIVGVSRHINCLIITILVLFNFFGVPIQVSNIVVLTVCLKFTDFTIHIFPLVPAMSTIFTSHTVQTTCIAVVWIL